MIYIIRDIIIIIFIVLYTHTHTQIRTTTVVVVVADKKTTTTYDKSCNVSLFFFSGSPLRRARAH